MGPSRRSLLLSFLVALTLALDPLAVSAQSVTWVPTPDPPAPATVPATPAAEIEPDPATEAAAEAEAEAATDATEAEAEADALVIDTEPEAPPPAEGRALSAPRVDPAHAERVLRNLAFAEQALAEEHGAADLTLAVAINLYVGGALLSIVSVSLLVGIVLESVCINGIVDECLDGPSFLSGFIPSALGAAALLIGAQITEQRASAHYRSLEERAEALEARRLAGPRAALEPTVGVSLGLGSLRVVGTF